MNNSPTINGNTIVSYTNNNCFIQCLSATGNNWLCFRANNNITDSTILATPGTLGAANSGNLNFYCSNSIFNCGIQCATL